MKKKKAAALILAAVLIVCSFASGLFRASAQTQQLMTDTEITNTTDGLYDKNWYYFTPEQTGMYTFLSFNRLLRAEAYLFEYENKNYNQLAYSNSSPNYEYYGQPNQYQFCISYQLEAGKTYFYAAGWSSDRTSGEMTVKLIYEGSEEEVIDYLEVESNAELTWYTDGTWETDEAGEAYFKYNYSKILQNMTVYVHYKSGQISSVSSGGDSVDGYTVKYSNNQPEVHWYPKEDERYSGNYITVSILNKSAQYDVKINQNALFNVYGALCDYTTGEAVSGASVIINNSEVAQTDSNGNFSFVYSPGYYNVKISGKNILTRNFGLTVNVNPSQNDHRKTPIGIITCNYVGGDIINAKDFGYIMKNFSGAEREKEEGKFEDSINFTSSDYPQLIL